MKFIKLADSSTEMKRITDQNSTLPLVAMQKGVNVIYHQSSDKIDAAIDYIAGENIPGV